MDNEFTGLSIGEAVTLAIQESYEDLLKIHDIVASNEAKELKIVASNKDLQGAMNESEYTSNDLISTACNGNKYRYTYNLTEAQKVAAKELDTIHEGFMDKVKDFVKTIIAKAKLRIKNLIYKAKKFFNAKYAKEITKLSRFSWAFKQVSEKIKGEDLKVKCLVIPSRYDKQSSIAGLIDIIKEINTSVLSDFTDTIANDDEGRGNPIYNKETGSHGHLFIRRSVKNLIDKFKEAKIEDVPYNYEMLSHAFSIPRYIDEVYKKMDDFLNTITKKYADAKNRENGKGYTASLNRICVYAYKTVGISCSLIFRSAVCLINIMKMLYKKAKKMKLVKG